MLAEYFDKIRGLYASRVPLTRSGGLMLAEYFGKIRGLYASRVP